MNVQLHYQVSGIIKKKFKQSFRDNYVLEEQQLCFPTQRSPIEEYFHQSLSLLVFLFFLGGGYFKCAEQPPGVLLLLIHFALQSEKGFCNLAEVEKLRKEKGAGRSWFNSNSRKKTVSHPRQKHKGSKWV